MKHTTFRRCNLLASIVEIKQFLSNQEVHGMAEKDALKGDSNFPLIRDGVASYLHDSDPEETTEWLESLDGLLDETSTERARFLMLRLLERATAKRVPLPSLTSTDFVNTIPTTMEPEFPGDEELEKRYRRWIRWNAAIMVHRGQRPGIGVGGHISTYAGAAPLYEVGFNHFFRGKDDPSGGDQVFFQGHASPGMYARAFMEGRLDENDLDGFRQEGSRGPGDGLPSYPHPHGMDWLWEFPTVSMGLGPVNALYQPRFNTLLEVLGHTDPSAQPRGMDWFWEFPTVSMGLGPINAIYQARSNKYLEMRGIKDTSDQHVWSFLGDGEMDEPESRGAIHQATLYELDNLTFVIN